MKDEPDNMDHAWIQERLAAAIAGGLSPQEQGQFDAHINSCPACFDAFTDARDADRQLQRNLGGLTLSADFEEILIGNLREKTMHKRFPQIIKRAGMGIAAAVAMAATGVFANNIIRQDTPVNPVAQTPAAEADVDSDATLPQALRDVLASNRHLVDAVSGGGQVAQIEKFALSTTLPGTRGGFFTADVNEHSFPYSYSWDYGKER